MKRGMVVLLLLVCGSIGTATAQEGEIGLPKGEIAPMLDADPVKVEPQLEPASADGEAAERVVAVYGVTAEDYLPSKAKKRYHYQPQLYSRKGGRASFDLPDSAYFVGGPMLISVLMLTVVSFIKEFEDQREEETSRMASEQFNPE